MILSKFTLSVTSRYSSCKYVHYSPVLTWYDFLLKTADIDEYLLDYTNSPSAHPKPIELLTAFLQRLSRLEDESTLRDNAQYSLRLADLSLKVVGRYFNWSLYELDSCLSLPLQSRLMTILTARFPLDSKKKVYRPNR